MRCAISARRSRKTDHLVEQLAQRLPRIDLYERFFVIEMRHSLFDSADDDQFHTALHEAALVSPLVYGQMFIALNPHYHQVFKCMKTVGHRNKPQRQRFHYIRCVRRSLLNDYRCFT